MSRLNWEFREDAYHVDAPSGHWRVDAETLEVTCDDIPKGHAFDLSDVERRLIGVVPVYPSGYFLKEDLL